MIYTNRYLVTQPDLNAHGTLHGGVLMKWVDEACGMQARMLTKGVCATRFIGEIEFVSTAKAGDILEVSFHIVRGGKTSITFKAEVINITSSNSLVALFDKVVFVAIDKDHKPRTY